MMTLLPRRLSLVSDDHEMPQMRTHISRGRDQIRMIIMGHQTIGSGMVDDRLSLKIRLDLDGSMISTRLNRSRQ
jgi:hypothetical protein